MFVADSHVPLQDAPLRTSLRIGATRPALVGVAAVGLGWLLAHGLGTTHASVYAAIVRGLWLTP